MAKKRASTSRRLPAHVCRAILHATEYMTPPMAAQYSQRFVAAIVDAKIALKAA
jgi:hypothetical protein